MHSTATAMAQMRENCARDLPWFTGGDFAQGRDLVVVAGGPSLLKRLDKIRDRQAKGGIVMACNGARGLLASHGIEADMVALLDIGSTVTGFIPAEDDGALYLVASIIHPSVLDALDGRKVVLWHCCYGEGRNKPQADILAEYPQKPGSLIGGGNTIGVRCLNLGFLMGFRTVHYYGLDSSIADDGADHAYIKHEGAEPEAIQIEFDGKKYRCSPWMANQAQEFEFYYRQFTGVGMKIMVHGDGLIPDIWKRIRAKQLLAA